MINTHSHNSHEKLEDSFSIDSPKTPLTDWIPLGVVLVYILGLTVITAQLSSFTITNLLSYSMGYFFIIFSLFKMINLSGFAKGYNEYDLISIYWYTWGYIAPFVELLLGTFYLLDYDGILLHLATIIYSVVIVIGVGIKLAKKEKIICACLGTILKVPLTKVSLIEYATMSAMAFVMLIIGV